jgi:hypothetical protein
MVVHHEPRTVGATPDARVPHACRPAVFDDGEEVTNERDVAPHVDDGIARLDRRRRRSRRSAVAQPVEVDLSPDQTRLERVPDRRRRVDVPVDAGSIAGEEAGVDLVDRRPDRLLLTVDRAIVRER